jgi:hypothetical protein
MMTGNSHLARASCRHKILLDVSLAQAIVEREFDIKAYLVLSPGSGGIFVA